MRKYIYISATLLIMVFLLSQCQNMALNKAEGNDMNTPSSASSNKQENTNQPLEDSPAEITVHGEYMKAFLVAYEAFKKDPEIPIQKRQIEHYSIEFRQDTESYLVLFDPKSEPSEAPSVGGETELGVEVSYTIRKKDLQITARTFYR